MHRPDLDTYSWKASNRSGGGLRVEGVELGPKLVVRSKVALFRVFHSAIVIDQRFYFLH